jgi:hypothetical protein
LQLGSHRPGEDKHEVKASLIRIEATLAATLPHMATDADLAELRVDLAEKPGKIYLWACSSCS